MPEYKFLRDIQGKHYFYDRVESIEDDGMQTLYDVYFNEEDHSYLSNGFISHNSFTMALYCGLRALLIPGRKIVVAGAAFRQSKVIFEYLSTIHNNAPVSQSRSPRLFSITNRYKVYLAIINPKSTHINITSRSLPSVIPI